MEILFSLLLENIFNAVFNRPPLIVSWLPNLSNNATAGPLYNLFDGDYSLLLENISNTIFITTIILFGDYSLLLQNIENAPIFITTNIVI